MCPTGGIEVIITPKELHFILGIAVCTPVLYMLRALARPKSNHPVLLKQSPAQPTRIDAACASRYGIGPSVTHPELASLTSEAYFFSVPLV